MLDYPSRSDPLSADWARDVVREIRRGTVTAGSGLRETQTANGKILSLARPPPSPAAPAKRWPASFDIAINGATVTVAPGAIESGGTAYSTAKAAITITADGQYIGVSLNRATGVAAITGPHNSRPLSSTHIWATALYSFDLASGVIAGAHDRRPDIRLDAVI